MASRAQLHAELIGFLRQHCLVRDQRHLVFAGLDGDRTAAERDGLCRPLEDASALAHCLAASWQRRCQRWLANKRINVQELSDSLILWAIQQWQKTGHTLHLALETTMLWNRCCVVVVSVMARCRDMPLLWQTLEHPRASVNASVSMALLEKADQLLAGFASLSLLADRTFPCDELIAWFRGKPHWRYVMWLHDDHEIHGTAARLGCQVRRLRLCRGQCRGFRGVRLWANGSQGVKLVKAHPTSLPVE